MQTRTGRHLLCLVLIMTLGWLVFAANSLGQPRAAPEWAWAGALNEAVFEFSPALLEQYGVVIADARSADTGIMRLGLASGDSLRFQTVGASFEHFVDGALDIDAPLVFAVGAEASVSLGPLSFTVHAGTPVLMDEDGEIAFELDQMRIRYEPERGYFSVDGAGLVVSPATAHRLGRPLLAGMQVGGFSFTAQTRVQTGLTPQAACSDPVWPGSPGEMTDVQLTSLGTYAPNWGCDGSCTGSSTSARTWWSPSATLENAGTTDVPWYDWLGSSNSLPLPPYNNRQHPLLTWSLYRIDSSGIIEQIGRSGIKHGYYSTNTSCTCGGGHILWSADNTPNQVGCRDTYSAANNNESRRLGPRTEIVPAESVWGRCGSAWDPDCDGTTSDHGLTAPIHRMAVREADVADSLQPGAQFFLEAWYLIRDDDLPDNNLRNVEVTTSWNGSAWSSLSFGDNAQSAGPVVNRWVEPGLTAMAANQLLETADGRARLAVRVTSLSGGWYRYDYALMNLDFAVAETQGAEPDLRVVSNHGFDRFEMPASSEISFADAEFADGVGEVSDWTFEHASGQAGWVAPASTDSLDWGRLYRFGFSADRPPAVVQAELSAASGLNGSSSHTLTTLAPYGGIVFEDRFEVTGLPTAGPEPMH